MKIKLRLLFITLFFFFTTQSFSNPINKINFIGLNNSSEESLFKTIPFQIGQEYSSATSNEIIESLFKTGLFSDISVIQNEDILDITLVENPTIKYFNFELNSGSGFSNWLKNEKMLMSNESLDEELAKNLLSAGNPFTQRKLDEFILLIESKFAESGYYNPILSSNISVDSQNRIGIEMSIDQGDRAKIEKFRISGAEKIDEALLLELFKIGEADMMILNYFTNKDLFTEIEFREGIDSLNNYYFDQGYMDFKILSIESLLDDKKENISIDIQISEGIQYKLGKISFEGGSEHFSKDELSQSISLNQYLSVCPSGL